MPHELRSAVLSPDGRYVAYGWPIGTRNRDIRLYDIAADKSEPLIQHPADDFDPFWSPGGQQLTFLSTRGGGVAAWIVGLDETKRVAGPARQLSPSAGASRALGITDEGGYVLGITEGGRDVYEIGYDPDTDTLSGEPRKLVRLWQGGNHLPAWSPDGRKLAFISLRPAPNGGRQVQIVIRDEPTGEERLLDASFLKPNASPTTHLTWHHDSRTLLVLGPMLDEDARPVLRIVAFSLDSSAMVPWVTFDSRASPPVSHVFTESPDGTAIYYVAKSGESIQIIRRLISDGRAGLLVEIATTVVPRSMAITSDGKRLAVADSSSIYVIDIENRKCALLFRANRIAESICRGLAWTAAGDHLLFGLRQTDGPPQTALSRIRATGGEAQSLMVFADSVEHLTVHPNGRQIAFTHNGPSSANGIWLINNSRLTDQK